MEFKNVYISHTNCITPLGFDVDSNIDNIEVGISGLQLVEDAALMATPFYAGIIEDKKINVAFKIISPEVNYTRLEKMMLLSLEPVISQSGVVLNNRTALIVSTTKGNITSLESNSQLPPNVYLDKLAKNIADFFGFEAEPIVVCNACVSGILAVSIAKRLLQAGMYDNVFVVAGDEVSKFVLSGFNAFQAMSPLPCKPYSANRDGISIGEASAAVLVTNDSGNAKVKVMGDSSINDANHISGPSRTGEGLVRSIENALKEAGLKRGDINYISGHGTATTFNDEMEAIAFNRTGLQQVPVNSLKGYYGHTLGASGLLETVIGIESMLKTTLYASLGYDEPGVSQPINVITENKQGDINYFLKTASGFGGCNTAVVFKKVDDGSN